MEKWFSKECCVFSSRLKFRKFAQPRNRISILSLSDTMYYSRGSIYRVATQYTKSFKRVLISVSFRVQLLQLSSASRSIPPIPVGLD